MSKKLPDSRGAIIQINQQWSDKRLSPNQWPENKRTHLQTEEEFFLCILCSRMRYFAGQSPGLHLFVTFSHTKGSS